LVTSTSIKSYLSTTAQLQVQVVLRPVYSDATQLNLTRRRVELSCVGIVSIATRRRNSTQRQVELRRYKRAFTKYNNIVFGLVYVNLDDLFVFSPCHYTRGHKFKLYKRCVRANFFSERVINCWNSLPHTVDFSSFSKFKRSVKRVDFTDFLRF